MISDFTDIVDSRYSISNEGDFLFLRVMKKYDLFDQDYLSYSYRHYAEDNPQEVVDKIVCGLGFDVVEINSFNNYTVVVLKEEDKFYLVRIQFSDLNYEQGLDQYFLYTYFYAPVSEMKRASEMYKRIKLFAHTKIPDITWITSTPRGIQTNELKASDHKTPKDIYYPSIEGGIDGFINKYEDSSSPILIILGPPGMGKTSFIKHYIYEYEKKSLVSYDTNLLQSDEFFLYFLNNSHNLLVMEDFDVFLQSREDGDNHIMSKFLNLSQGIVGLSNKKMIFTGNIERNKIDQALVRPGRCFEILEFDYYDRHQANAIIEGDGLTFDGSYSNLSLADLLSNKQREKRMKVGF